jgi:hypothetical protein
VNYTFAPVSVVKAARARRIAAAAGAIIAAVGLAACGVSNDAPTLENNGVYVTAGPITYQLQISRQLNQYATEDRQYVTGLPPGVNVNLAPSQLWYGVFLWAKNQTKRPVKTSDNIDIVDTEGNHYYPVPVNPSVNPYAWTAQSLPPGGTEPAPDTAASFGPTQGSLLLFRLPTTVYDNRPLTLQINGPSGKVWATISLDL